MSSSLSGKTMIMSGGSRGIGLAIALRAARDGANVVLLAKTADPHPKLEGTVFTAAQEIEAAGGHALPVVGDVRNDADIADAVSKAVDEFGGVDICVNNASAIDVSHTEDLDMKQFDLMQSINVRGTFSLTKACIPYLRKSVNPHVLTLSPPLNLAPHWLGIHPGYMLSKYGMTLSALGFAEELRADGIASNALWPRTLIATAAVKNLLGGQDRANRGRTVDIMADAAYEILTKPAAEYSGNTAIDDEILSAAGVADFEKYRVVSGSTDLELDIFLD